MVPNWYALAYAGVVVLGTYGLRMSRGDPGFYYLSDLFNWRGDNVPTAITRWAMWTSVPLVMWETIQERTTRTWAAVAHALAWWFVIYSGVDARVFGQKDGLSEPQRVVHFTAAGIVLGVDGIILVVARFYATGTIWLVTSIAYGVLFILEREDVIDLLPGEFYIAMEYVYYGIFILLVLGYPTRELTIGSSL